MNSKSNIIKVVITIFRRSPSHSLIALVKTLEMVIVTHRNTRWSICKSTWSTHTTIHITIRIHIRHWALNWSLNYIWEFRVHIWHLLFLIDHVQSYKIFFLSWVELFNNLLYTHLEFEWTPIVFPVSFCIRGTSDIIFKATSRIKLIIRPFILFAEIFMCN